MINLFLSGSNIFVWNAEDVITLRKEHRIVGSLVGTCPKKKLRTQRNWLPLLLIKEEAKLLIEKGIAQLVRSPEKVTDPLLIESYFAQRNKLCEEQMILMKEKRKRQIREKADEIYEGKKRKYLQSKKLKVQTQKTTFELTSTTGISLGEKNLGPSDHADNSEDKNNKEVISMDVTDVCEEYVGNKSDIECNEIPIEKCEEKINESLVIAPKTSNDGSEIKESESSDINLSPENDKERSYSDILHTAEVSNETLKPSECLNKDDSCDFLSKEAVIEAEIAKIPDVDKNLCMVQLFTECPWKNTSDIVNFEYPSTEMEKLRYRIFKDLWEKSYYITGGMKFGGDFLAYKGDPLKYHAVFIVICIPRSRKMTGLDIITRGRLGKQVKKIIAFANIDASGVVQYCCTTFAGDMK